MPVHLEFTATFRDYLCAQRLHAKRNWRSRLNDLAARRLNPILGALILAFVFLVSALGGFAVNGTFVFMVASALCLLCYPFYLRYRLKSFYSRTRTGDGSRILDFDQESIKAQGAHAKTELDWSAIQFIREDKNVFMLYLAPAKFLMIPKGCCPPEVLEEIKRLYNQSLRASAGASPA